MKRWVLAALAAAAVAIWVFSRGRNTAAPAVAAHPAPPPLPARASPPATAASSPAPAVKKSFFSVAWGSGPGQLGRTTGQESSPEAPMSIAIGPNGETLVLDQVNGRIARFSRAGAPLDPWPLQARTPRDLAVGPHGEVAVLDPGSDSVTIGDKSWPLQGALATSVTVDRDGVWIEEGHAWNVRVDADAPKRDGKLSRDNQQLLSAAIIDAQAGTAWVRALDASTSAFRWQRRYAFAAPILRLVLLDSFDAGGLVFAAQLAREIEPGKFADQSVEVLCLDAAGAVLSQRSLPPPEGPEESMRELAAGPDGSLIYLHRTRAGLELIPAQCP